MARSKVGKALAGQWKGHKEYIHKQTMNMPNAMAGVMGDPGKRRAKKFFKEKVIERGRVKQQVRKGKWSGKSARMRVGGTIGS